MQGVATIQGTKQAETILTPKPINATTGMQRNLVMPQTNHVLNNDAELISANVFALPDAVTVTCRNTTPGTLNANVFNTDFLNASATIDTYQDGFAGNMVSRLLAATRASMGAICYGVTAEFTDAVSGVGIPANLGIANPVFLTYNTYGRSQPLDLNATVDHTRKDFNTYTQVWRCTVNQSRFTQFQIAIGGTNISANGVNCVLTFNYTPNFSI